jgi:hypothetical protein
VRTGAPRLAWLEMRERNGGRVLNLRDGPPVAAAAMADSTRGRFGIFLFPSPENVELGNDWFCVLWGGRRGPRRTTAIRPAPGRRADRTGEAHDHRPRLQAGSTNRIDEAERTWLDVRVTLLPSKAIRPAQAAQHRALTTLEFAPLALVTPNQSTACGTCAVENSITSGFTRCSKSAYAILISS